MNLAKAVAEMLTKELKYPNGEPVECVIADTCIGGVAEATAPPKIQKCRSRPNHNRYALLVLRHRDDGCRSFASKGGMGL